LKRHHPTRLGLGLAALPIKGRVGSCARRAWN
jgi:hypothetical protein